MGSISKEDFQSLGPENRYSAYKIHQILTLLLSFLLLTSLIAYETFYHDNESVLDNFLKQKIQNVFNISESIIIDHQRDLRSQKYISIPKNTTLSLDQMRILYPNIQIIQYNPQKNNQEFGKQYSIEIDYDGSKFDDDEYGLTDRIQVASVMDHTNLSKTVDFVELEKKMMEGIAHQVIVFKNQDVFHDEKVQILQITDQQIAKTKNILYFMDSYTEMGFGKLLTTNINNAKLRLLQFLYYNKKYKISKNTHQTPICIYSSSYNIYSKNKYKHFFESVARQNYSNYHIVYIDDHSPDQSAYKIVDYLNFTRTRVNGKITIVHNLQRLGALANAFFWTKKYCAEDSIVINIDGDDSLLGTQVFQVLNSVYKDPNTWYVYSKYINYYPQTKGFQTGYLSSYFSGSVKNYRTTQDYWVTSHLRTCRQKLLKAIPIQHFIEYHYDRQTKIATPKFYDSAADRFQVYSQFQLAGDGRVVHITDPLHLYDPGAGVMDRNCYHQLEFHEEYKSRIKTPLQTLKSLSDTAKLVQNYKLPSKIQKGLSKAYILMKLCKGSKQKF